jgi:hypothetical protein
LNWIIDVVSSWFCFDTEEWEGKEESDEESERAGRTRAANLRATRLAYGVCVKGVNISAGMGHTSRVWQLKQLTTSLCGGDAQVTLATRWSTLSGRGSVQS